jgi:hypothetical protein
MEYGRSNKTLDCQAKNNREQKTRRPDMKKVILAVICAVVMFGMIAIGYAERGEWRGGLRTRIHEAKGRIEQGIERGSLTRQEARGLHGELDRILDKINRMKDDGLNRREREIINSDLDRLDRHITREKRDDDTRRRR